MVDTYKKQAKLLIDDLPEVSAHLDTYHPPIRRIDIVADNAGFELVCDLILANFLLTGEMVRVIHMHLKPYPVFVSDTMIKDAIETFAFMEDNPAPEVQVHGSQLQEHVNSGGLQLVTDGFWASPLDFWDIPSHLRHDMAQSDLAIIKGDANYRRLLGDRHWKSDTPFQDIVCYLPTPIVALRVLKSELLSGIGEQQVKRLNQEDPQWLTSGRYGSIQFAGQVNAP